MTAVVQMTSNRGSLNEDTNVLVFRLTLKLRKHYHINKLCTEQGLTDGVNVFYGQCREDASSEKNSSVELTV